MSPSELIGRIVKGVGGNYHVATALGEYVCFARGLFRKKNQTPLVGDFVEISVVDANKQTGYLQRILPRFNELSRPRAANVDQVVLVCAVLPPISFEMMDGFLINCENLGVEALLCINKIDLDADRQIFPDAAKSYELAGYTVVCVSAEDGRGLGELERALAGKTSILAGPSGVGKSSILNALYPQISLEVGDLSKKISRGKHTTRHTSLIQVGPDTFVVDSPGFTSFSISHISRERLHLFYREFAPYRELCYYVDCLHVSEHDCAVKEQVGGDICPKRYERYIKYQLGVRDEG